MTWLEIGLSFYFMYHSEYKNAKCISKFRDKAGKNKRIQKTSYVSNTNTVPSGNRLFYSIRLKK